MKIFPRIFRSNNVQTVYLRYDGELFPEIKLQPMEKYLIPHDRMRIDEEERYPFFAMKNEGDGLYSYEYAFQDEQKYSIRIRLGEDIVNSSVYALDDDLFALRPFKGDTHIHTTRSDGKKPPFETACDYRAAGYDFIAITDHHQYQPSIETQNEISSRTEEFTVFRGEEVHNGPMGYVHIVNFGGKSSVSRIVDESPEYVRDRVSEIMSSSALKHLKHPYTAAFRQFIFEEIRKTDGVAVLAHPFWDAFGEYNMDVDELIYHLKNKTCDAFELLADDDQSGNGDNLQVSLYYELAQKGVRTTLLSSSDCHDTEASYSYFNRHFSIVFADKAENIVEAVKNGYCVAVNRRSDSDFFAFGDFRLVKYARFLLETYYPEFSSLSSDHARAMLDSDGGRTSELVKTENAIAEFKKTYFGV